MRKKNLPANLSLELSVSDMRDWFINELQGYLEDMHEDAIPSEEEIKARFDEMFPEYRDDIRQAALDLIIENSNDIFGAMLDDYRTEIEEKHYVLLEKDEAEKQSANARAAWDKIRPHLTIDEIAALKKDIKSRE